MSRDSTSSAFLDIATNLLAVMLILTLFALVAQRHDTGAEPAPASHPPTERFLAPRREWFPPFSRFFFVTAGRVVPWDQEAVVAALAAAPTARAGRTWQGRYEWQPEPLPLRDLDGYRLRFFPEVAALVARVPPWTSADTERLVAELSHAASARVAAVFIVHPDGMAQFAPLHEQLRARALRFRWFPQAPDAPLEIGREVAQFTHHVNYW